MKATEKVVLDGLRKTTLKYLSDEDYAQIVDAVEKQGLLGLTGAAGRMVKTAVIKHGSHDQKTHGRGGKGGGGGGSSTPTKEPQDAGQRMWDEANTLRTATPRDIIGTGKQGEVRATREELTEALGNPEIGGMDKSTIEWGVVDRKTGVVATVYDWKRNPESGSRSEYATKPPEMNEILEYQIGGTNGAVELVSNALLQAKRNKTNKSIVTKHGSHDQKTHGRKGGGGGGGGSSFDQSDDAGERVPERNNAAISSILGGQVANAEDKLSDFDESKPNGAQKYDSLSEDDQKIWEKATTGINAGKKLLGDAKKSGTDKEYRRKLTQASSKFEDAFGELEGAENPRLVSAGNSLDTALNKLENLLLPPEERGGGDRMS